MSVQQIVDTALATTMHSLNATYNKSVNAAPGALVYGRDMFLDLPVTADWVTIQSARQRLIDANLRRQNQRRRVHDFQPNEMVMIRVPDATKMQEKLIGPYRIHSVHTNGTVSIVKHPYVIDRINIRKLHPVTK